MKSNMLEDRYLNKFPIYKIRKNQQNKNNSLTEQSTNISENAQQITKCNQEKNSKIEILIKRPIFNIPIDYIIQNKEKENNYNEHLIIFNNKEDGKNNIKDKIIIYEQKPVYFIPINKILKEKKEKLNKHKNKKKNKLNYNNNNNNNNNDQNNKNKKKEKLNNNLDSHININKINNDSNNFLNNQKINLARNGFYYNNNYNNNDIFKTLNYLNNLNYITNKLNEQKAQFKLLKEMGLISIMNHHNMNHYLLNNYINNLK